MLERLSLLMLVGGILFEIITGVLNIQYDYIFGFSFYTAHYYGAWVFIAGFVVHIAIKIPQHVDRPAVDVVAKSAAHQPRRHRRRNRTSRRRTGRRRIRQHPTISRRGALALVGGGALFIAVITAGQTLGGFTRKAALLLPRGRTRGDGPNDFQVNRTPRRRRALRTGADRRQVAPHPVRRARRRACSTSRRCAAMPQHAARLPIACVEGWSTTETWSGVPLRDLARACRASPSPNPRSCVRSNVAARFNRATLQAQPGHTPGFPAGASGQRRRPVTRPRLPGADHRSGVARRAQHQMGRIHRIQGELTCHSPRSISRGCTARIRCTC